jgi:ABC-type multidrug transport system fused ATPase/permease subunit
MMRTYTICIHTSRVVNNGLSNYPFGFDQGAAPGSQKDFWRNFVLAPFASKLEGIVIAGPPILSANDLALSYGYQRLLEVLTLSVAPGEKVGLVGRNGSGKTSLLRILAGHQEADAGEIARRRGLRVGYLPAGI